MRTSLALVLVAFALAACGGRAPQSAAVKPVPGERLAIARSEIAQSKPLAGEITTRKQADALARIPGILVDLRVREGDTVAKGQILGRIVENRLGYETNAFAAQTMAAAAQSENAQAELKRVKYLYERGFVAKARLDAAEATARSADAQVNAARSQRSASESLSSEGAVLAPAAGRVLRADVPPGSPVTTGMSIATLTAGPPVLRLDVPQSLVREIRVGTNVRLQDASELDGRHGAVVEVYPAISGGRVRADVAVDGLTSDFVGRRVSALVEVGTRSAITLPRRFVSTRFGVDYVALVDGHGSFAWVPVQTAPTRDPDHLEILSGVSPGDVIVAAKSLQ